jgi:hypothetical protein
MRLFPGKLLLMTIGPLLVLVIISGCGCGKSIPTQSETPLPVISSNTTGVTISKTDEPDYLTQYFSSLEPIVMDFPLPESYITYSDPNGLFKISYPGDWEITKNPRLDINSASNSAHQFLDHNTFLPSDNLWLFGISSNSTPNTEIVLVLFKSTFITFTSTNPSTKPSPEPGGFIYKMKVKGRDAVLSHSPIRTDSDMNPVSYAILNLSIHDERCFWIISCRCPPDKYKQWENDFNTVVANFRLFN